MIILQEISHEPSDSLPNTRFMIHQPIETTDGTRRSAQLGYCWTDHSTLGGL
ncbi:hypothetical protein [Xenorhabdus kozodoii]|uniref:hypothetical protein n=1 Tax=Xenorhabdus kozodoii TaxID=351676 RepID=UPI00142E54B2|nr:hypothetical protein [Xenorhabdus kozodoii]